MVSVNYNPECEAMIFFRRSVTDGSSHEEFLQEVFDEILSKYKMDPVNGAADLEIQCPCGMNFQWAEIKDIPAQDMSCDKCGKKIIKWEYVE